MPVNPNVLDPNKWVKPREKEKKQEHWLSRVTVTTDSGKQYNLDSQELNWIKNRYAQDNADSYGYDTADQQAKAAGQLSAKTLRSYTKSAVDQQLAQMGLPSEKNLDKYRGEFQQWHTGGIKDVFGNSVSSQDWTNLGKLYQQGWQYSDSAEDQLRKKNGQMPVALEKNYTDTEIDDRLKAAGLPSYKDFNTYWGQYGNQQAINALYANAAGRYTQMRTRQDANTGAFVQNDNNRYTLVVDPETGRTETKTGRDWYAQMFYDELGRTNEDGSYVYDSIMPLLKSSKTGEEEYIDPSKSYIGQMDDKFKSKAKEDKAQFDGHSAFSYDDFVNHYGDYYDKYWKDVKMANGQTVDQFFAVKARDEDEQATRDFYDVKRDNKDEVSAFVKNYFTDYPDSTPAQMFADCFAHGMDEDTVYTIMRKMATQATQNNAKDGTWGYNDIKRQYAEAQQKWLNESKASGFVGAAAQASAEASAPAAKMPAAVMRAEAIDAKNPSTYVENRAQVKNEQKLEEVQAAVNTYYTELANNDRSALYDATQALRGLGFKNLEEAEAWIAKGGDVVDVAPTTVDYSKTSVNDAIDMAIDLMNDGGAWTQANAKSTFDKMYEMGVPEKSIRGAAEYMQTKYGDLPETVDENREVLNTPSGILDAINHFAEEHGDAARGDWTYEQAEGLFKQLSEQGVSKDAIKAVVADEAGLWQLAEYADRYFDGVKYTNERRWVNEQEALADKYVDEAMKKAEADAPTIKNTENAIRAALYDEEGNDIALTNVDSVIKVLDQVADLDYTNPVAYKLALTDLGFGETFSGLADDLTANWSDADKNKLAYHLGLRQLTGLTPDDELTGFNRLEGDTIGDTWAQSDYLPDQRKLDLQKFSYYLDWAHQEIAAGRLTEYEAYNILAAKGYQDELEEYLPEDWHRAHFMEKKAPELYAQSADGATIPWEEVSEEGRAGLWDALSDEAKNAIYGNRNWWKYEPTVYRTGGQAFEQQMLAVLPEFASELMSGGVKILDAIGAGLTGRPEMWETTQNFVKVEQGLAKYGSVEGNVNGAKVADMTAGALKELLRMETLGSIGGIVGEAAAGTRVGSALAKVAGSETAPKVVKKATDIFLGLVRSSPFMVSVFAGNYAGAKQLGAPNGEAAWYALRTAIVEGALEGFNFEMVWGRALGQKNFASRLIFGADNYRSRLGIIAKAWVSNAAISGLGEWTEESIGYVHETYLKRKHLDTWGKGTEWSVNDWLEQATMGFITGALGGGINSIGSFVSDGVTLSKALRDNPQLRQQLPDILASVGVAGSIPESTLETYRKGGAKIMSLVEMNSIIDQDEGFLSALRSAYTSLNDEKAKREAEYDTKVNEINATVASAVGANIYDSEKLNTFVKKCKQLGVNINFDAIWNTDPQTWAEQIQAQAQAAKQAALDNAKNEYESSLTDLETDFAKTVSTNQNLLDTNAKKVQEHYVGLFLQNEQFLSSMSDEMLTNISEAYMNGGKYEPGKAASIEAENPNARAAETVAGENPADPDNIPWFSKKSKLKAQGAEARPFTDEDAQKVVDVAKALKYKGGITFVDEPDANWQGSITKSNGNIVINKAKLSASDIQKLQNNPAMWVLEHELVHYMGEKGTPAYKKFHSAVVSMLKNSPYIRGNDMAYNAVLDGMIQSRAEQGLGELTREQAEEELVANFAMEYLFDSEDAIRSLFQTNGSVGQQILSWLRYKIDRAKLRRSKESWARDILDIERMYAKAYRETRGKTQSTESTNNKAFSAASTRTSYDYSKSLEEIYQDYKDHKMPTDSPVVVGGVGGALSQIGLSRLPVFMNPTHVRYVTNDNAYAASHPNTTEDNRLNHAFTKEEFAKLRSELEDPIAVIAYPNDRDKTINVLTSMRSKNGRLAVVALHLDSSASINGVQNVEGYDVKTIHGRDNYWSLLRNALESDSESNPQVFYLNFDKMKSELSKENSGIKNEVLALSKAKEKASATGRDGQYSSDRPAVGAFMRSISDAGYRVNTKSQLETKQFQNWFNGSRAKYEDGTPIKFWRTSNGTYTTDRSAADGDETYYLSVKQPYKGDLYITRIKYGSLKDAAIDLSRKGYDSFLTKDANGDDAYIVFRKGQAKLADDANIGLFDKTIKNATYSGEGESLDWLGEESQDEEDPYADWEPTDDDVYDPWGSLADAVYGTSGRGEFSGERVHAPEDTHVTEAYRPRDDNDVGKKLARTGDEYTRRNWVPKPPSYMVVDGKFVGRDNLDTGVTAADDEEYMQAAIEGDYKKTAEMKDAVAKRVGAMTIAHGEQRGYAYDSINYGRDFGGAPNYFGSTDINTAQTYASNTAVGRGVREFRVAPNEFDAIEEALAIDRTLLSEDINLGLDLSYVLEDNLIEPGDPVLMFADSELTPEQASELEEYPMRPVYRVYDKDTGEVLARTYPVSYGRGTTTDAIGMLHDLEDRLGLPRSRFSENSVLTGGVQMDYVMPGDQNTYEGSSAYWDEVPTTHDENAQAVDVEFLARNGGTLMRVVDSETGEVLHDKQFDGYDPEAFTHLKQLDVQRAFDEWYGQGEDLWEFATYNAKPLDASSDDMYTRGMMVYNLYDADNDMPAFVEKVPDWNRSTTDEIGRRDYGEGFDSTLIKNISDASDSYGRNTITDVYMGHNPALIKSASPIELKRNGEIVPLSEMFNDLRNDKRYSAPGESVEDLLRQYGAIDQGREPRARDIQVPRQTNDLNRVSQWIQSLVESGKLTDEQAQNVLRMVVEHDYGTYIPTSQAERMEEARAYIAERQPLQAQQEFHDMVMQGKFGVKTNALGIQLLSDAAARGDFASVLDIAADLQLVATEAGQSAQIFNVLKELKGVGSAWYMQKVIDRMNSKYADKIKSGKMKRISVDPELMANLAKATTIDQIAAAEEAVAKNIARQLPLTWDDRLSSWRYFSMLANPTTHIRNITGNLLMKGLNTAKDITAIGVQRAAEKLGLASESDRAHAWLTSDDKSIWGDWVQQSYEEQARNLSGGSKLGFESFVKQNMRSFDTKWVDALARFNFKLLEGEDIAFIRPAYKNALMQYMKAQGYTLNGKGQAGKVDAKGKFHEITKAQMNEAIDWASQQAWKQTFRDASSLATMLNKLSKENAVSRLLVEGVMPFKKTPINIARRGVDYSPAGIIKGIAQLTNGVKKGKVTTAQAIDTLSSGITGSALMALGVMLAKLGIIRAGGEKDKKLETYLEDTGDQTYAIKFGDKSINMSSIAPATIPLFMGVALNEMIEQSGETIDLSTITDTIAGTLNPFMEMSFMASLNSALKNYNNNGIGGALGNTLMTAAQNYGSQYLPTIGGKVAQFFDPTRRTTKSDATSPVGSNMDYYARSLAKKIPGLEATLQPDVDVWGRTDVKDSFSDWAWDFANKFILPTNVKVTNRDAVDNELIRVVESTGVTDFLPSDGNKYFTVKGEKYTMNARQYSEYSQERGQAAYVAIKELMASPAYQAASDETKADMLNKAKEAAYKQVSNLWKEKLGAFDK